MNNLKNNTLVILATIALAVTLTPKSLATSSNVSPVGNPSYSQADVMETKSNPFKGAEVNGGTASVIVKDGKTTVRLSDDFKVPASPAPHFQIVDSEGNVFLLRRLTIVGNKTHRDVVLPSYIKSVAKVQIYCAFAEIVLGEATFDTAVMTGAK